MSDCLNNCQIINVVGNGKCLFRALSYRVLKKNQRALTTVRKKVVDHIVSNWGRFEQFISDGNYESDISSVGEYDESYMNPL